MNPAIQTAQAIDGFVYTVGIAIGAAFVGLLLFVAIKFFLDIR